MKKIVFILLLLALALVLYAGYYQNSHRFKALRVAHAGGGINGSTYTNSYNALNLNIKKGFKYFELDFFFTKDGELVCLHDWTHSFKRSFGFSVDGKITLQEFKNLAATKSKFEKCTLDGLSLWMKENPSAFIVTDVKEDNYKALQVIAKEITDSSTRVIPQVYDPNNFHKIKQIGYKQIIWTLYRYQGDDSNVLEWVNQFERPFAVTMPKQRAVTSLPEELQKKDVPTYVHTVNSIQEKEKFLNKFYVTEIYTDFL
jgi:glycerophosphoryl diester phosphodiesterase